MGKKKSVHKLHVNWKDDLERTTVFRYKTKVIPQAGGPAQKLALKLKTKALVIWLANADYSDQAIQAELLEAIGATVQLKTIRRIRCAFVHKRLEIFGERPGRPRKYDESAKATVLKLVGNLYKQSPAELAKAAGVNVHYFLKIHRERFASKRKKAGLTLREIYARRRWTKIRCSRPPDAPG